MADVLTPPQTFTQLRALTISALVLVAFGVGFMLWSHGLRPASLVLTLIGMAALAMVALVQPAIWASHWGTRLSIIGSLSVFLFYILPWSIMLAPLVSVGGPPGWMLSGGIAALLVLALTLSAAFHARRAAIKPGARSLQWPGCEIDLKRRTILKRWEDVPIQSQLMSPALIGGCSVVVYHLLKTLLPQQGMILIAVLLCTGISLWLCVGPLGRALGQGWRLRSIEQQDGGTPFTTERLPWLRTERQRSAIGRWWAQRTP
jgi:hypothetical protein